MSEASRRIAAPRPDPESAPFWDAARRGALLLKRCRACGNAHYFPRPICPFCMSAETEWIEATGAGTIYSFSVMRRAAPSYALAYVTLDEGVTMMTNLVDCDFDALKVGMRVKVAFKPSDGGPPVPMFTPL
ncbi:MAG TPA: Zn-ribbon domain-containing OB-fold protein [Stellaceae bacterium]|nr:Zn-ribbon domain-containing OB-fold protein [Stellaceae bacterium]